MNERDFCYWLRGFFELTNSKKLNKQQVKMIKEHMDLALAKVTSVPYYTVTNLPSLDDPVFIPSFRAGSDDFLKAEVTCNSPSSQEGQSSITKIDPIPFTENQWGIDPAIKCHITC